MSKTSIKITIAGRVYPINVDKGEEESLKKIEKDLDSHMKHLRDNYAIKDNQDILAMTLLEYANRLQTKNVAEAGEMSTEMLLEIDTLLNELH